MILLTEIRMTVLNSDLFLYKATEVMIAKIGQSKPFALVFFSFLLDMKLI